MQFELTISFCYSYFSPNKTCNKSMFDITSKFALRSNPARQTYV